MSDNDERFVAELHSAGLWRVTFKKTQHEWRITFVHAETEQEAIKKMMEKINDQ